MEYEEEDARPKRRPKKLGQSLHNDC